MPNAQEYRLTIVAERDGIEVRRHVTGFAKGIRTPTGRHGVAEAFLPMVEHALADMMDQPEPAPPDPMITSALASAPVLSALPPEVRDRIAARCNYVHAHAGDVLAKEGAPADGLYVLLSGRMTASVGVLDGRRLVLAMVDRPELLGDVAALDGGPRTATLTAETACDLVHVPQSMVEAEVKRSRAAMLAAVDLLCARIRHTTDRQAASLAPLRDRVIRVILMMVDEASRNAPARAKADLPLTQALIAEMVGATRPRVAEILQDLESEGLISRARGRLRVGIC